MRSLIGRLLGLVFVFALPLQGIAATANSQALTTTQLRVCADPSNLPFSNEALEGFENKIIELVAEKLELSVHYTWYPQTTGFVRNTLRLRECDLISGITTTSEKVQNTNPYYQSVYTMVYRKDSELALTQLSDPQLKDKKIGVVAGTPPANIIAQLGLLRNITPYQLVADTRIERPAVQAIEDVASGKTDVALIWGPIAGYQASQMEESMEVVPLTNESKHARMAFRVSMAVRYNETEWKRRVNAVLKEIKPEINEILHEYGVPLLNDRGEVISP
ncbi:MAG: substrate-binding domain-containing protein [Granulosicoccus sp.]